MVRALSDAPDGRPMQWRMIEHLDGATADAVEFAAARGWVWLLKNLSRRSTAFQSDMLLAEWSMF